MTILDGPLVRVNGPCLVAAQSQGGSLETPPRWHATIYTPWVSRNSCAGWGPRKWHHKWGIKTSDNSKLIAFASICDHFIWFMISLPVPPSNAGISAYPGRVRFTKSFCFRIFHSGDHKAPVFHLCICTNIKMIFNILIQKVQHNKGDFVIWGHNVFPYQWEVGTLFTLCQSCTQNLWGRQQEATHLRRRTIDSLVLKPVSKLFWRVGGRQNKKIIPQVNDWKNSSVL